jgi:hypothetical protein
MATTHTRSAPASGLPYYVWEVPEKPISVVLYFDVIDRMYPDIMRGLGALKRRGAEVGGILLGRPDPEWPGRMIVEDFEAVPTEYLTGPSYNLSENDLQTLEEALERRQSNTEGEQSVVGFYRSHTRDDLYMDGVDLALASRYFPDAGNVFLLVKPFATRTSIGGFFFWEDGEINRESTYLQFPFHRGELGGGEPRPLPQAARPATDRPLPPYTPAVEKQRRPADPDPADEPFFPPVRSSLSILSAPAPPAPPRVSRTPGFGWLLGGFLALAGVVGFFAYQQLAAPKTAVNNTEGMETSLPLKLSVAEKQNQLDVTWDRNAPAIMVARRGLLSISDGLNKRDLELSGAQLRTGRVLYSRLSADVSLRLEVYAEGPNSVTESIRIVSSEPQRGLPETQPASSRAAPVERQAAHDYRPAPAPIERTSVPEETAVADKPKKTAKRRPSVSAPKPAAQAQAEAPPPEIELQRPARRR